MTDLLHLFDHRRRRNRLDLQREVSDVKQIDVPIVQADEQAEIVSQQTHGLRVLQNPTVVFVRRANAIDANRRRIVDLEQVQVTIDG